MGTIVKPNQAAWKQNLFSPWPPWPQPSPIHTHKHQAPQAWPTQKLDPTVTTMPNTTFSIPMWLLLMYLNGVTVVETILNISEKNTCPKRHTTSKPSYDGEMQGEQFYDYNHGGYAPKAPEYAPPVKVPSYTAR